jgi:hypothetical protein
MVADLSTPTHQHQHTSTLDPGSLSPAHRNVTAQASELCSQVNFPDVKQQKTNINLNTNTSMSTRQRKAHQHQHVSTPTRTRSKIFTATSIIEHQALHQTRKNTTHLLNTQLFLKGTHVIEEVLPACFGDCENTCHFHNMHHPFAHSNHALKSQNVSTPLKICMMSLVACILYSFTRHFQTMERDSFSPVKLAFVRTSFAPTLFPRQMHSSTCLLSELF